MRDALMAIDAGLFAGDEKARMDVRGAAGLLGKVHRDGGVAVSALQRIVGFEARPFVLGQFEPHVEEFLPGVDRAEDLAPDLL